MSEKSQPLQPNPELNDLKKGEGVAATPTNPFASQGVAPRQTGGSGAAPAPKK